jgi:hypothetical protein
MAHSNVAAINNRVTLQSLRTEIKVGFTFAGIAILAADEKKSEKRIRNQANARKAYDTALRLFEKKCFNETVTQELKEKLGKLKSRLEVLGEHFASPSK